MPVQRMPGPRGRVSAEVDQLEAWLKEGGQLAPREGADSEPEKDGKWPSPRSFLVFALIVVAFVLAVRKWPENRSPSSIEVHWLSIIAKDTSGMALWNHEFPQPLLTKWNEPGFENYELTRPLIVDLDGDGKSEVLFTYSRGFRHENITELYCFEANGKVRWKFRPGRTVMAGGDRFPPPYCIRMVIPVPAQPGAPLTLMVVSNHYLEYPSLVTALSPEGKPLREYWHSGQFYTGAVADLENDGRQELYLVGISNSADSATVVVLDPQRFGGASLESDPRFQLLGFGQPNEIARSILPPSAVTRQSGFFPRPDRIKAEAGGLAVYVRQVDSNLRPKDDPEIRYLFGPRGALMDAEYTPGSIEALQKHFQSRSIEPFEPASDLQQARMIRVLIPWREAGSP